MGGKLEVYTADGALKQSGPNVAEDILITDAGGYFDALQVEAALQELAATLDPTTADGGLFRASIRDGEQIWKYTECDWPAVAANTTVNLGDGFIGRATNTASGVNTSATEVDAAALIAEHPGVATLGTGTNAGGLVAVACGNMGGTFSITPSFIFGSGTARMGAWIYIPVLSNAAGGQQFNVRVGWMDRVDAQAQANGVYFRYKDDVNSGRWEFVREVATVETAADSGVAVAATTWYKLEVLISDDGEQADFFINGSNVGNVTAIAEGTGAPQMPMVMIGKALGTTSRFLYLDSIWAQQHVTR